MDNIVGPLKRVITKLFKRKTTTSIASVHYAEEDEDGFALGQSTFYDCNVKRCGSRCRFCSLLDKSQVHL